MKHTLAVLLFVVALGTRIRAEDKFDILVYTANKASAEIQLDGKLDDPAWGNAPQVGGSFTFYGKPDKARPQTFFRVLYTDRFLYVGVTCEEPKMDLHKPTSQARDAHAVFSTECIEFFVDPAHSHSTYYQIAVNSAASIYDSVGQNATWSADVRAATTMGRNEWTMEIAIPWKDLGVEPIAGRLLGFNICRDRHIGEKQWTNWSRCVTGFHDPHRFGHVLLGGASEVLGALGGELRKGERSGPIVILSDKGSSRATYRALAKGALKTLDENLARLRGEMKKEKAAASRQELGKLLAKYTAEIKPVRAALQGAADIEVREWTKMDLRITDLNRGLANAVWEARLAALIRQI
ncbi:MAG: carbohydrate-binding family 9-like protein [Lentisphaeria bacterium]|nr:carbohydrate-binding family 9-like protein [Lentisphaeria bacterium]